MRLAVSAMSFSTGHVSMANRLIANNNIYLIMRHPSGVNALTFQSMFNSLDANKRQSVLLFGNANGTPVCTTLAIQQAGSVLVNDAGNQKISSASISNTGLVTVNFSKILYDDFALLSTSFIS